MITADDLEDIRDLREALAFEASLLESHLTIKAFPRSVRPYAEALVLRMRAAARGEVRHAFGDPARAEEPAATPAATEIVHLRAAVGVVIAVLNRLLGFSSFPPGRQPAVRASLERMTKVAAGEHVILSSSSPLVLVEWALAAAGAPRVLTAQLWAAEPARVDGGITFCAESASDEPVIDRYVGLRDPERVRAACRDFDSQHEVLEALGGDARNSSHRVALMKTAAAHGIELPRLSRAAWNQKRLDNQVFGMFDLSRPADAYAMGLLQTDGSHSGFPSGKGQISLELNSKDFDILHSLQVALPCPSNISSRKRATNFTDGQIYESSTLRITNMEARRELEMLGLPVGRKSLSVAPPTSETLSHRDYVRGLFDGDGSVGFTGPGVPFLSFVTQSPALAQYVAGQIFLVAGVTRTIRPNKRDGVANIIVTGYSAVELARWMYYPGALAIDRKMSAAVAVADWIPPVPTRAVRGWTDADDSLILSMPPRAAATALKRTRASVGYRRWELLSAPGRSAA